MLNVYFRDEIDLSNSNIERDVERLFSQLKPKGTELERKCISIIEKGKYNDEYSFIDRFGYKLYYDSMSTGCKAALCVLNFSDKIIDLVECGLNARDLILNICKEGNVIIVNNMVSIHKYEDYIDVGLDGYRFTTVDRLNYYIDDERPFEPDMNNKGVYYV